MEQDLVSVIMPTFNAGKYLSASIESVLAQTYHNFELLITDDASTDDTTVNILKKYSQQDSRVKVLFLNTNHGPGYARNQSIERAQGRYIAFCDSDDRWMPEKLERQIAFMQEKHSRLVFSSYIICDENNEEKGIFIAPDKITFYGILRNNKIGCLTAIYDSQAIGEKFYMPTLRKRQDWALFINILKRCRVAHGVKEPLAYYRIRSHSVSRNKFALIKYNTKVYRETLGFSKLKSWLYFLFLFMPSHTMKVIKRKIDSKRYLRQKNNF